MFIKTIKDACLRLLPLILATLLALHIGFGAKPATAAASDSDAAVRGFYAEFDRWLKNSKTDLRSSYDAAKSAIEKEIRGVSIPPREAYSRLFVGLTLALDVGDLHWAGEIILSWQQRLEDDSASSAKLLESADLASHYLTLALLSGRYGRLVADLGVADRLADDLQKPDSLVDKALELQPNKAYLRRGGLVVALLDHDDESWKHFAEDTPGGPPATLPLSDFAYQGGAYYKKAATAYGESIYEHGEQRGDKPAEANHFEGHSDRLLGRLKLASQAVLEVAPVVATTGETLEANSDSLHQDLAAHPTNLPRYLALAFDYPRLVEDVVGAPPVCSDSNSCFNGDDEAWRLVFLSLYVELLGDLASVHLTHKNYKQATFFLSQGELFTAGYYLGPEDNAEIITNQGPFEVLYARLVKPYAEAAYAADAAQDDRGGETDGTDYWQQAERIIVEHVLPFFEATGVETSPRWYYILGCIRNKRGDWQDAAIALARAIEGEDTFEATSLASYVAYRHDRDNLNGKDSWVPIFENLAEKDADFRAGYDFSWGAVRESKEDESNDTIKAMITSFTDYKVDSASGFMAKAKAGAELGILLADAGMVSIAFDGFKEDLQDSNQSLADLSLSRQQGGE